MNHALHVDGVIIICFINLFAAAHVGTYVMIIYGQLSREIIPKCKSKSNDHFTLTIRSEILYLLVPCLKINQNLKIWRFSKIPHILGIFIAFLHKAIVCQRSMHKNIGRILAHDNQAQQSYSKGNYNSYTY